jgi:hypothetical protein
MLTSTRIIYPQKGSMFTWIQKLLMIVRVIKPKNLIYSLAVLFWLTSFKSPFEYEKGVDLEILKFRIISSI